MADASLVGRLLVATPQLGDPNFVRTVVLVVQHREEGAVGVVLNRPSEVTIEQVLPNWAGLASGPPVVFRGGPVSPEAALCLARVSGGEEPIGWRCLEVPGLEDLGLVDLDAPPVMLAYKLAGLRVFAGYAGWDGGQLESEIGEGAWYLLPAVAADPFSEDPGALWRRVLRRQGGQLAMLATMPDDPALN